MLIGLHDSDKTAFPNLALMKISSWHKKRGDQVEWWVPIKTYDMVYSSKVFTFTPEDPYLPKDTIKGGTGYGIYKNLPQEIDNVFPDYSIYPSVDYAIGYLTRGCIRSCSWCIVPKKEGSIKPYQTWEQIKRPDSKKIVFMDNNVLACDYGVKQIRSMLGKDIKIDFNQGLDARLITPEIAEILSGLKWIRFIRMSADTDQMLETVIQKIKSLKNYGVKPYRIFVYVLVTDVKSAEKRCLALKRIGARPFAQPFRTYDDAEPTLEQKRFARYVNNAAVFNSLHNFEEYGRKS